MAFSNPQVYLDLLARPLCKRFEAEPTSYELAITSCIMLFHFADVVAHVRNIQAHEAAKLITDAIPEFATMRALANAGKHVELTRHPNAAMIGLKSEDLKRGKGAAFSDGSYFSDGATWSDMPETIVVETTDGRKHDILHLCLSVLKSLDNQPQFFQV